MKVFVKSVCELSTVIAIALTAGCANTACCLTTTSETESALHYVVIGFGVISIPKPKTQEDVVAVNMKAAGLVVTNQPGLKLGLGYSAGSVVEFPGNIDNAVVEVRTCPDGEGILVKALSNKSP